jgi:hypothetical protein
VSLWQIGKGHQLAAGKAAQLFDQVPKVFAELHAMYKVHITGGGEKGKQDCVNARRVEREERDCFNQNPAGLYLKSHRLQISWHNNVSELCRQHQFAAIWCCKLICRW